MTIGFLHNYVDGGLIKSSDWNDELNQILAVLGYGGIANPNLAIMVTGQIDDDSILRLNNLSTGDYLELTNGTLSSLFKNNGQINIGANGVVGLIIASIVKCPNLNADLLDSKNASDLENKLYVVDFFGVHFTSTEADFVTSKESYIFGVQGGIITKLKGIQTIAASVDASTICTFYKNGVSIGTVTISGNTTALQTNDIADVDCVENDVIDVEITTHSGTTKHDDITFGFSFKKKYIT